MNGDQFEGVARNLGGQIEGRVGKLAGDDELRAEGLIDQIAGAAQTDYGDAKEAVGSALDRAAPLVRDGAGRALSVTRENTMLALLTAGAIGYAIAWAFHGEKSSPKWR